MQYIGFFAGSEDLTIRVTVGSCSGGVNSLEVGFFYTEDCQNFERISFCDTDIEGGQSTTFSNNQPLVIGQHYYLVIDGSGGANCDWTFNVLSGTTAVDDLTTSGAITHPVETCPGLATTFETTGEVGAAFYTWTVDGVTKVAGNRKAVELTFDEDGTYEVCVTGENVCDVAPQSCTTIIVRSPETLTVDERLCDGECIEYNDIEFCNTGTFQEVVTLPNGCDSIIDLTILVLPQASEMVNVWICNDDFFYIGPNAYNITGTYADTILTADDCDSIVNLELRSIECEIIGTAEEIPVICYGTATGTLVFSVDQGEPPLEYSYTNIVDGSITGMGTTDLLVNNEIPGIPVGTYQIYITDDFGNDVVVLQEVTEPPVMGLELVASDYEGFNVSCDFNLGSPGSDGSLMARPRGGVSPYTYQWSDGQMNQLAENLTHIEYTVTVTDAVGCTIERSFTLTAPPPLESEVQFNDPTCEGFESGIIKVINVSGGTSPYLYALNDNSSFAADSSWNGLSEGTYQVYLQDANGCITQVDSSITAPQIPVVNFIDDLTVALGDSLILQPQINDINIRALAWTPEDELNCTDCLEPYARTVNDTEYTLTVTSEDDCTGDATIRVKVDKRRRIYIPNVFSPDGNTDKKFFINAGLEAEQVLEFNIYDRWGNLVFSQQNFPTNSDLHSWSGRDENGKEFNSGIYVWHAKILFIDSESFDYSGTISLIR